MHDNAHAFTKDGGDASEHAEHGEVEVRSQLGRILASPDFVASERNRRFLAHVVERSLAGQRVKGYEIGAKIFGRGPSFNATTDPIVRIEAGKLRRDLETYYLKSGRRDRLRISLAKGAYRAVFTRQVAKDQQGGAPRGSVVLLRAALLGLARAGQESPAIWSAVMREYPEFPLDPLALRDLEELHGGHEVVRGILLEGLRRAAEAHGAQALPAAVA
jgi:hypothetical protein